MNYVIIHNESHLEVVNSTAYMHLLKQIPK